MNLRKIITFLTWIVVALIGLLVAAEALFPTGDQQQFYARGILNPGGL